MKFKEKVSTGRGNALCTGLPGIKDFKTRNHELFGVSGKPDVVGQEMELERLAATLQEGSDDRLGSWTCRHGANEGLK